MVPILSIWNTIPHEQLLFDLLIIYTTVYSRVPGKDVIAKSVSFDLTIKKTYVSTEFTLIKFDKAPK